MGAWFLRGIDRPRAGAIAISAGAAVLLIAALDYTTGTELRIYPLYYAPVALVAWRFGNVPALVASGFCALAWFVSNYVAAAAVPAGVWLFNLVVQLLSFSIVGYLVASLRVMVQAEKNASRTDALTSLLNARGFSEEAETVIRSCSRYGHPLTLAYIDLDNFKAVNDSGGHAAGDRVLQAAARLIRDCTRYGDIAARIGGDEFVLLLPETSEGSAHTVLERLRARAEATLRTPSTAVTMSIGAAAYRIAPPDLDRLLKSADYAMYCTKHEGKNKVRIHGEPAPGGPVDCGPASCTGSAEGKAHGNESDPVTGASEYSKESASNRNRPAACRLGRV
jgi:diguanylate cyclase (GGDEF)-like protein